MKYRKEKCLTYAFMLYIIHILLMSFKKFYLKTESAVFIFFLSLDLWNYCLHNRYAKSLEGVYILSKFFIIPKQLHPQRMLYCS